MFDIRNAKSVPWNTRFNEGNEGIRKVSDKS
jgi:hypothetical protein